MMLDTTTWLPMGSLTANTYGISGLYNAVDSQANWVNVELAAFANVAAAQVLPLRGAVGVIFGSEAEMATIAKEITTASTLVSPSGLTFPYGTSVRCFCWNSSGSTPTGVLIHEWHHALDFAYSTPYGVNNSTGRSSQSDIQALWTRAQTFWAAAPEGQSTFYGWTNVLEFFAELSKFYWLGQGSPSPIQGAVNQFRQLISGYTASQDDSYITAAYGIFAGLTPPPPPGRH